MKKMSSMLENIRIWYILDFFFLLFLILNYFLQVKFSFYVINIIILIVAIVWSFYRFLLIFEEKNIFLKLISICLTVLYFVVISVGLFCECVDNLIFPEFERDTYVFPDNSKERFVVRTNQEILKEGYTGIYYQRELFFGIICESEVDFFQEEIIDSTNIERDFKFYEEYFQSQKLEIDYQKYIEDLRASEQSGFCYRDFYEPKEDTKEIYYHID